MVEKKLKVIRPQIEDFRFSTLKGALFTPPTTTSPPDDWRPKEAPEQGKEQRKERGERNDKQESKRR